MGMTIAEKILAQHAGLAKVCPGELVTCQIDMALANDVTAPPAIKEFERIEAPVFDREKIALVLDHFQPAKDIKAAALGKAVRDFARKHHIKHFYDIGRAGIEHVILPEFGLVGPGMLTIGADSHTCTYGALNGLSTGVGSTDLGVAMATGEAWFKVPQSLRVELQGTKPTDITGKDVVLELIGRIGVDGALYQALEFTGEGVHSLSMADRLSIANMAIEAGAKAGIFPYDDVLEAYLQAHSTQLFTPVAPDADAQYHRTVTIDLNQVRPVVAFPHLPSRVKKVADCEEIAIDQVVIGSCTNGRLEDLAIAAQILQGHKINPHVRCLILPGSQAIYREAMKRGYIDTFLQAECAVSVPTCGPCLGGYMGILTAGERCVSTTNRNFRGRMGHVDSEVYLAGPQVAAASAILGKIAEPAEVANHGA